MRTPRQVVEHLRMAPQKYDFSEDEVRDAMDEYCRGHLMLAEDDKYFSLAIPSNPNW
jgi:hypothetical protein